jgi:hypothetical protein
LFVLGLFSDGLVTQDYAVFNGHTIPKQLLGKDLEGNGYSFIYGTIPAYPPAILRNHLSKIDHYLILPSLAGLPNKGFPTDFFTKVPCAFPRLLY